MKRRAYAASNPRTVPVGREQIRVIADELTDRILKGLDAPDYADDAYPIGTVAMLPDVDLPIVASFGGPADRRRGEKTRRGPSTVKVDIWVRAANDGRTDASIEGDTKAKHPADYPAGYMPYGLDITLSLPGKVSKRSWKSMPSRLGSEVYRVLMHEATHFARLPWIRGKKSPRARKSEAVSERIRKAQAYLNDREEVEARAQEIVEEAFEYLGRVRSFGARPSMQTILEFSPAWQEIEGYLTEENKRRVVQKVYRALSDAGIAPTRASEATIEREFGEDDDEPESRTNPMYRDNPTIEEQQAVVDYVRKHGLGPNMKAEEARDVIRAYLRAKGLRPDSFGNYKKPDVPGERVHFSKQRVQHQSKTSSGWSNLHSYLPGDWARIIVLRSAEAVGDVALAQRFRGGVKAAKKRKAGAAKKADRTRLMSKAQSIGRKQFAMEHPDIVTRIGSQRTVSGAKYERAKDAMAELADHWLDKLESGAPVPDDSVFASADAPPVLPVFFPFTYTAYTWTEQVGGVAYSIHVAGAERGTANVNIGAHGKFAIDPLTRRMYVPGYEPIGDAQATGRVVWDDKAKRFDGVLFMVTSLSKQKGAGSRVIELWCRMMQGYGIDAWIAEAVGDEGMAFITALERKGKLSILGGDRNNLIVGCLGPTLERRRVPSKLSHRAPEPKASSTKKASAAPAREALFKARNVQELFDLLTQHLGRMPTAVQLRTYTNTVLGPWEIPQSILDTIEAKTAKKASSKQAPTSYLVEMMAWEGCAGRACGYRQTEDRKQRVQLRTEAIDIALDFMRARPRPMQSKIFVTPMKGQKKLGRAMALQGGGGGWHLADSGSEPLSLLQAEKVQSAIHQVNAEAVRLAQAAPGQPGQKAAPEGFDYFENPSGAYTLAVQAKRADALATWAGNARSMGMKVTVHGARGIATGTDEQWQRAKLLQPAPDYVWVWDEVLKGPATHEQVVRRSGVWMNSGLRENPVIPRIQIRKSTYRGRDGFSISGRDRFDHKIRIFASTRPMAEAIRNVLRDASLTPDERNRQVDAILLRKNPTKAPEYAYHVTFHNRLATIADRGLLPIAGMQGSALGKGGYAGHSKGKLFLTEQAGAEYWYGKAEDAANAESDDPLVEGYTPIVLRVPMPKGLQPDESGSDDSGHAAWYATKGIAPARIEAWTGGMWIPVSQWGIIEQTQAWDYDAADGLYILKRDYENPLVNFGPSSPRARMGLR